MRDHQARGCDVRDARRLTVAATVRPALVAAASVMACVCMLSATPALASVGGFGAAPATSQPANPATRAYFQLSMAPGSSYTAQITVKNTGSEPKTLPQAGDAEAAFAAAEIKHEAEYGTPAQHHNAIELFTATCVWEGPQLTIYEPSQMMWGTKAAVERQPAITPTAVGSQLCMSFPGCGSVTGQRIGERSGRRQAVSLCRPSAEASGR